jgi:hypothetical protein
MYLKFWKHIVTKNVIDQNSYDRLSYKERSNYFMTADTVNLILHNLAH